MGMLTSPMPLEVAVAAEVSALPGVSAFAVPAVRGEESAFALTADRFDPATPEALEDARRNGTWESDPSVVLSIQVRSYIVFAGWFENRFMRCQKLAGVTR